MLGTGGARRLVFCGIPLLLAGTSYLFALHRGEQVVSQDRGGSQASAPAVSSAEEAFAARFAIAHLTYSQPNPDPLAGARDLGRQAGGTPGTRLIGRATAGACRFRADPFDAS